MADEYSKKYVPRLFLFVAAVGFIFGYDIGMTGCLTSAPAYLKFFFPHAYDNLTTSKNAADSSFSCKLFDDHILNIYRSSFYLLAFASTFAFDKFRCPYSHLVVGSMGIMVVGTSAYLIPLHISYIAVGRIVFGFGMGLVIQIIPAHIFKIARSKYRGRVIVWFQLAITVGILMPNLFWFAMPIHEEEYNWMVGSATIPLLGSSVLMLPMMFHVEDNDPDPLNLRSTYDQVQIPWSGIISKRKYWPSLVVVACLSVFQQLTGLYAFMIYAPILLKTIGWWECKPCSIVMCGINCIVAFVSFASFDKFSRRNLFMHGGFIMLTCQIIITFVIGVHENQGVIPKMNAILLVVAICGYTAGFAWSWGPLGWLLPSEILPLEIQSVGQRISICLKMIVMFFVTQFFMLGFRKMMFHMCLLVLSLVLVMTAFVYKFLPETVGIEVENVFEVWKTHPYWKRYIEEEVDN